jgi:hypothetical protein
VTYFPTFKNQNGCDEKQGNTVVCLMMVLATPIDRNLFYQTRLAGTNLANEQCVVYQGTGGIVWSFPLLARTRMHPTRPVSSEPDGHLQ